MKTNVYKGVEYTIIVPSNRPHFYTEIEKSLPFNINYFDGGSYKCYAKLINDCICVCPTETIFIINDKIRPKEYQIYKCLDYNISGFGMSWLEAFFGCFDKEFIRQVGFFDERYSDGHYEDSDMIRRSRESDIGLVMYEDVDRIELPTQWLSNKSSKFHATKWNEFKRLLPDEKYSYDIGPTTLRTFRLWQESIVKLGSNYKEQDEINYKQYLGLI